MSNYERWLEYKETIKGLTEKLHEIESEIWLDAEKNGNLNPRGSKTFDDGKFKVTINHVESVKVDQKAACMRPDLFRIKYEFDKIQYKNLIDSQRDFVDEAITISMNKPSFRVERI